MSRVWPYEYRDSQGGTAEICPAAGDGEAGVRTRAGVHVIVTDLAAFTSALYAAAGKPEPVILERLDWEDCHQDETAGIRTYLATGNLVGVDGSDDISPGDALHLAARLACLAAKAKQAAAEPDPAEVGELAALMDAEMERRANGQSGLYPAVARIALQWMNGRQQRGGERS